MSANTMDAEQIEALVRRYMSVDGETGEAFAGRIVIAGGSSASRSRNLTAPVPLRGSPEQVTADVLRKLASARSTEDGIKRIFVRVFADKASHAEETVALDGSGEVDPLESDDTGGSVVANALAKVALAALAQNARLVERNEMLVDRGADVLVRAVESITELNVRTEVGYQRSIPEAIREAVTPLAPHVPAILDVLIRAMAAKNAANGAPAAPPPKDTSEAAQGIRSALDEIESAAAKLASALVAAHGGGHLTAELRQEVETRLRALISSMGLA